MLYDCQCKEIEGKNRIGKTAAAAAKSPQSCLILCDPKDGSPPGSPFPGILQAKTLEWVAISFSNIGKTRDFLKKSTDTKGIFHAKIGSIKDRNGMDLTEVENIKLRWQEYTELYKKDLDE